MSEAEDWESQSSWCVELDQWAAEQAAGAAQPPQALPEPGAREGGWLVEVWSWICGPRSRRQGRHNLRRHCQSQVRDTKCWMEV